MNSPDAPDASTVSADFERRADAVPEAPPSPPVAPVEERVSAGAGPARLGLQAMLVMVGIAICALAALFWPRDGGTFREPGGFLYDGNGQATTLGPRLTGVTVVHFWATWCAPCITEIPALQRLGKDFAAERSFSILFVAVADDEQRAKPFLGSGADMALYDPKWDVAHRYGTRQLPESYVIVDGKVVQKFDGPANWDDPALRESLRARIRGQKAELTPLRGAPGGVRLAALGR